MIDSTELPELFQFRYSIFPELARWALDYKGIAHYRRSVLPGPHAPKIKKLAQQTAMPVLRHRGKLLTNSVAVLDYIEQQWPSPSLYPENPQQRQQAIEIRDRFRGYGPDFRLALFYALLSETRYTADLFSQGFPLEARRRYARFFGVVKLLLRVKLGVNARQARRSRLVVEEALDWLAANINEHGYLVGEQFSVADLTAATVVIVTSLAEGTSAAAPKPYPAAVAQWVNDWNGHPAVEWAESIYRRHRPASVAVEDSNY